MEKMNDLKDLFKHEIQDLYSVEEQIIKALPDMIAKANNVTLKNALSEHLSITEEHKNRLDKVQQMIEEVKEEKKEGLLTRLFRQSHVCKGMQGIIDEGNKVISEDMSPEVLDAAIIASVQKVEHYEICGYGTARTYARELGMEQVARLLEQTLNEEYEADDRLTALAVTRINKEAETAGTSGGDSTASGASKGRTGRETSRERIKQEEMEMEPVRNTRTSASRKDSGSSGRNTEEAGSSGRPGAASAPRAAAGRASASAKKPVSNARNTKSTKSNARSTTSGGRGSGTSARGRK
jgi:ferritin-like metal-binding protein YciE